MANTKISALTPNTNPSGSEEMVYALNNANGKMSLNTMKTFVENNLTGYATTSDLTTGLAGKQDTLVSGTNIRTINGASVVGSGDIIVTGGTGYTAGPGIDITGGVISATGGGAGGYDCVVSADGTGDYTTIGAAVNAGKKNIFVKNGNYTESAQRDVKTAGNNILHVTGESYLGVNVTVSQTITITGGSSRFIDMALPTGFTEFDFYMKNLNFILDFGGNVSYFFRTGSGEGKFLVEDCGFTYSGGTGNNYLFYGNSIFEMTTDGYSYSNSKCNMFNRCVFSCSTDATNGFVYVVSSGSIVAENCVFYTTGTGTMSLVGSGSGNGYLRNCNINVYGLYFSEDINLINTNITIASGGSFYYHSSSNPNDFRCSLMDNCSLKISGDLGTAGAVILGGVCKNCFFDISATNLTELLIGGDLFKNQRHIHGGRIQYSGTTKITGGVSGLDVTGTSVNITAAGELISGINMINGGTVSITGHDNAIIGNIWNSATVTDSGSDNVVANNVA